MSEHIEFFTARDDAAAAAVRRRGPGPSAATVSASWLDADDAVITWENILTDRVRPNEATRTEPRMVAGYVNDGSGVFAVPEDLVHALADAGPPRLRQVALAWRAIESQDGNDVEPVTAVRLLTDVAGLSRRSVRSGHRVYCWVSG